MVQVSSYERPKSLDEALAALEVTGTVPMGGGTRLAALAGSERVGVVDLQAAGLGGIQRRDDGKILIGATTTLDDLANSRDVPAAVREAARRERPSSLRTLSTVGGCVATAEVESELLATFLVYRASVRTADSSGASAAPLGDLLANPDRHAGKVITHVEIETGGYATAARVGRTPSDTPIVAAVARRDPEGNVLVAFAGVAATPVLAESTEELVPPDDFRGSSEYRKSMAETLGQRVREAVR
jgi:CO/xanthine dehydrogenase FAD-binding subunit